MKIKIGKYPKGNGRRKIDVQIDGFEIETKDFPNINFKITCSKGTYIRSMASDFGKLLNNGAHLSALRRTQIGEFKLPD